MFDGLVRRAVFAQADGVVCEDVDHALVHERRQTDGGATVVGEDEEGAPVRDDPAVQGHAIHDRAHRVLAHAEVHVASLIAAGRESADVFQHRQVRATEVGRAADEFGDLRRQRIEHDARGVAAGDVPVLGGEGRERLLPAGGEVALHAASEFLGGVGMRLGIGDERLAPHIVGFGAAPHDTPPMGQRVGGNGERFGLGPAQRLLGEGDFGGA
jgi:hypothetical protein